MECIIRHWKKEDAINLAACANNKRVQDNLRELPFPYTEADAYAYIDAMLRADDTKSFTFAIVYRGEVVGSIGVFRAENIHFRTGELGYFISERFWGKGIATSAVKQICKYVFNNTDMVRIFAEPFASNIASARVLEKSGFTYEGLLRSNAVKNGAVLDMKMYALLKNEMKDFQKV